MSGDSEREMKLRSVYHTLDSALNVLKGEQVSALPEVQELLDKFYSVCPDGSENPVDGRRKKLFIVFEGLDGSGKSTIAREVAKALSGVKKSTPPECVSSLREKFDKHSPPIRRAFYSLGNYIAAKEIQDICQEKPVFLDRYWHSTTVYALAHEFEGQDASDLPAVDDPVYCWPSDLMKPDLVLFLDVDERTRFFRHARRKQTTHEEDQLAKDQAFRNLVLEIYNRINNPPLVHVDSSQRIKKTAAECLNHIKCLPPRD